MSPRRPVQCVNGAPVQCVNGAPGSDQAIGCSSKEIVATDGKRAVLASSLYEDR
jgi:hypothetical protein